MTKSDPFAAPSRMYPSTTSGKAEEIETSAEVHEGVTDVEVPSGTISELKTWIGDDIERARAALEVEMAKEQPRVTLVEYLEDSVNGE